MSAFFTSFKTYAIAIVGAALSGAAAASAQYLTASNGQIDPKSVGAVAATGAVVGLIGLATKSPSQGE